MITIYVKCNNQGEIPDHLLNDNETIEVILLDDNKAPIARYKFILMNSSIGAIKYSSNNVRITFKNLKPNMIYEICPLSKSLINA